MLTAVTEARAKATSIHVDANDLTDPDKMKQLQDAQNALSGALGRLLAVSENYPDLKSNQNFLALAVAARGDREPHHGRAQGLYRRRAGL